MPMFQKLNKKTQAFVKFKSTSKGSKIVDVKQRNPKIPFKGIPIKK